MSGKKDGAQMKISRQQPGCLHLWCIALSRACDIRRSET